MKRYFVAAAGLLLSTSALAWAPGMVDSKSGFSDTKVSAEKLSADVKSIDTATADKSAISTDLAFKDGTDAKLEVASFNDVDAKTWTPAEPELQTAALSDWSDKGEEGKVETAFYGDWPAAKARAASMQTVDDTQTGVGGPLEEPDPTVSMTPTAAADNYPPCAPGPGDDRCIQLYEPGVRDQLAGWNESTGGLADHSATTAVGGPYEPVDSGSDHLAMNGDGTVDAAVGETDDGELAGTQPVGSEIAGHADYSGVGGPVEAQSGYPPCSPGPGDDRCIQLYEPGVTGAGN